MCLVTELLCHMAGAFLVFKEIFMFFSVHQYSQQNCLGPPFSTPFCSALWVATVLIGIGDNWLWLWLVFPFWLVILKIFSDFIDHFTFWSTLFLGTLPIKYVHCFLVLFLNSNMLSILLLCQVSGLLTSSPILLEGTSPFWFSDTVQKLVGFEGTWPNTCFCGT